jgi:hypothetical protein
MANPLIVAESRVMPLGVEDAFHRVLPAPLPRVFPYWHGPIPPVKEVRDQTGAWDAAGQTRTVLLAGGSMREQLTGVDAPRSFDYRLTDVRGPMSVLVDHVEGEWIFAPAEGGTEVTWRWTIYRRSPVTAWALPVFAAVWKSYARRVLKDLSTALTTWLR